MTKKVPDSVSMPLETPINFAAPDGQLKQTYEIELRCHSRKQFKKTRSLNAVLVKIMTLINTPNSIMGQLIESEKDKKGEKDKKEDEEIKLTAGQIRMAVELAADDKYGIDITKMLDDFEKLAMGGVIYVEGFRLNPMQFEDMDPEEFEKAMYEYLANFLMPSVMKNLTNV